MNLDEYDNTVFVWVVCCIKNDKVIYFESVSVEHIRKEIKQFIDTRNIIANISGYKDMAQRCVGT